MDEAARQEWERILESASSTRADLNEMLAEEMSDGLAMRILEADVRCQELQRKCRYYLSLA